MKRSKKIIKNIFAPIDNERGSISGAISGAITGGMYGFMGWGVPGMIIGAVVGAVVGGFLPVLLAPDAPKIGAPPGTQPFSFTSNTVGEPIPDVLGTTKLVGTLLYFGGERSVAIQQKVDTGGGGS